MKIDERKIYREVFKFYWDLLHPYYRPGGKFDWHYDFSKIPIPLMVNVREWSEGRWIITLKDPPDEKLRELSGIYLPAGTVAYSPLEPETNKGLERILYDGTEETLIHEIAHYLTYHLGKKVVRNTGGVTSRFVRWDGMGELIAHLTPVAVLSKRPWWKRLFS